MFGSGVGLDRLKWPEPINVISGAHGEHHDEMTGAGDAPLDQFITLPLDDGVRDDGWSISTWLGSDMNGIDSGSL